MVAALRFLSARSGCVLLLAASGLFCCSTSCAQQNAAPGPGIETTPADRRLIVWQASPSDELKLAAASLGLPIDWRPAARPGVSCAQIVPRGRQPGTLSPAAKGSPSDEGYEVASAPAGELALVARSQHGLANGLYDARRAMLTGGGEDPAAAAPLLAAGEHKPFFARRATYQFLSPWNLPRLSTDAFTLAEWKTHLARMRALGVNQFYFDLWASQYYHPDYPETQGNKALYDRLREVCDYAHALGMRTGMVTFPCQVPTWAYLAHREARPVEATNYHGIHLCPSRAWDATTAFSTYALEYFGPSVDDVVVEMQDPGSCLCKECCQQFPQLVGRFMETYRKLPGGPADRRIDLCTLHFRDWLEKPEIDSRVALPIKDLRQQVIDRLPPGTALVDLDEPTLAMGRGRGMQRIYFFFDLDPENGLENYMVFPHVKLARIESQIAESVERKYEGVMAYRMMPFAQYVADYTLFRKCWDPRLDVDAVLADLAAEWGIGPAERPKFVQAVGDLDAWDLRRDLAALGEANRLIGQLAAETPGSEYLVDLRDQVAVLATIGEFWSAHKDAIARADFFPPPELVRQVHEQMLGRRMFEAYTVHQHWELRAREMIGQRLRWWLQAM